MSLFDLNAPFLVGYALILTVLFGLVMGSFLNCLAWRMAHGGTVVHGRSACPRCGHSLAPRDLVPLFSWLLQKRRCRYCKEPISPRYPVVELLTAVCMIAIVLRFGIAWITLELILLTGVLLVLALVDLDTGFLPDSLLVVGIAIFLMFLPATVRPISSLLEGLIGGLALSVPLFLLSLVMDHVLGRDSMGGGDIKLFFVVGLYLGWQRGLFCMILACILGILFPLVCKIRTEEGESAFPFGPSIACACYLSFFVAEPMIRWYITLF